MDDLISRQAAIDAAALSAAEWDGMYVQDINGRIRKALEKLPSAQPDMSEYSDKLWRNAYERGKKDAQRTGRWIYYPEINALSCSECKHYVYHYEPYKFCPNCGARMEVEQE